MTAPNYPFPLSPESSLDQCIKCNICTTACPVAAVTDRFPGPKYAGPQAARFRGGEQPPPDRSVDYCSGCRVCNEVCPNGVKIAEINARARAALVAAKEISPRLRMRNNLIARTALIGNLGQPLAPLSNALLSNSLARRLGETVLGIARQAPLPPFARQRFTRWWRQKGAVKPTRNAEQAHNAPAANAAFAAGKKQVVFFHGCATKYYEPLVGRAAVYVLKALGFEVTIPPQGCCGLPLLSNGEFKPARRYHRRNVDALAAYARRGIPIVGTSTSCTLTLKDEAPELLEMWDEDTRLVAQNTYDLHEFLLGMLSAGEWISEDLRPIPLRLAYHQPCQYRAHGLGSPAAEVLRRIPQLEILASHAACCGIAGTYGYKKEKYNISMDVGKPLFDFVLQVGGPLAVCDSETCRWQIAHGTGVPAIHPVELLAYALGAEPEGALADVLADAR